MKLKSRRARLTGWVNRLRGMRRGLGGRGILLRRAGILPLILAVGGGGGGRAAAEEPVEQFLKALRDNGYYDVALDYLQQLSTSPLASPAFQKRIKFEMAGVYLDQLEQLRDLNQIEATIEKADALLREFAASNPPAELLAESGLTRATALFARGKVAWERGKNERATAEERRAAGEAARTYFQEALAVFQASLETQANVLKSFRVDPADPGSRDKLERLRAEYVKTRFMSPTIKEQIADTLSTSDVDRKKLWQEAAAEYRELYEKYARYRQGSYSRFTAARCHQKLGETKEAITLLIDLLASEIPRALKMEAALLALECWESERPYPAQEIAGRLGPLLESANARELREPRLVRLQLGYAKACQAYADQLDAGPSRGELDDDIRRLRNSAGKFAASVARQSLPEGDEARQLLSQWKISAPPTPAAADPEASLSFADARDQAIVQLELAIDHQRTLVALKGQPPAADTDQRLQDGQAAFEAASSEALRLLQVARSAAAAETSREDLNSILLRQSQLYLLREEWYEAAVVSEFLLERFPNIAGAREAAVVALRAYSQLLARSPVEARAFAQARLERLCQKMVQLWPGDASSADAANVLATLAIQSGDTPRALQLLELIPAGTATRAKLEVILGRLLWVDFLKRAGDGESTSAASDAGLTQAETLLSRGLAGLTPETLTRETILGALNLAQLYLERGELDRAMAQLETAPLAPLDLIKQKNAAASDPNFVNDTYRTALRAYIAGMRDGTQTTALTDKAQNVVAALQQSLIESGGSADQIVKIYYQLARELLAQLERIESPEEKNSFSQSLATFMRSIQENSRDGKTLVWVGSTLNSIADNLQGEGLADNAQVFRGQAIAALDSASQAGFGTDPQAESLQLELQRQKALALRGQERFEAAVEAFAAILKEKPNLISAQIDAAETLERHADRDKSATRFAQAVGGLSDQGIWGWRRIVMATRGKENFLEIQHDAIYHLAFCQFRYGEIGQRDDARQAALRTLADHHKQYPQVGGTRQLQRFNALAKQIQKSLGQPDVGLQ